MSIPLKLSKAEPLDPNRISFVRLHAPVNWGPIGAELKIDGGKRYELNLVPIGVEVLELAGGERCIIPISNVKFIVMAK